MYYRIKMDNRSNVNFDIDQLHFFIRDRKKAKRNATQEIEIKPLYVQNDTPTVKAQWQHTFVFALPKFTIPDQKYLAVQLMERNGGRHMQLDVHNKALVRSTVLPSNTAMTLQLQNCISASRNRTTFLQLVQSEFEKGEYSREHGTDLLHQQGQ